MKIAAIIMLGIVIGGFVGYVFGIQGDIAFGIGMIWAFTVALLS